MQRDLFSFIENLFTKQEIVDTRTEFKEIFMVVKFLSLYPATFMTAAEVNRLSTKIPSWASACHLYSSIEENRKPKFNYPKSENKSKYSDVVIKTIAQKFCCSKIHAEQIACILDKEKPEIIVAIKSKNGK